MPSTFMIYYFDIDGTLCTDTFGEYEKALPFINRIKKVNQLYDEGHTIILYTARGAMTSIDWSKTTKKQLKKWGLKYHNIIFGKPHYDLFIDNKAQNANIFFKE